MSSVTGYPKILTEPRFAGQAVRNIAAYMFDAADRFADSPAVGIANSDLVLTYRQFADKVRACALSMKTLAPQEPVGLLSENRPEWAIVYFAILASGGMVVPIDTQLKEAEVERILHNAAVHKSYVSARYQAIARIASAGLNVDLYDLEKTMLLSESTAAPACPGSADSPAVAIFTSGTSGNAKQVVLTHGNIMSDIDGVIRRLPFGPGDRFLSVLPLHHTFEATCGLIIPLTQGCAVYYINDINSREILEGIKRRRPTHFISVPLLYEKIYHGIAGLVRKAPISKRIVFHLTKIMVRGIHWTTGRYCGQSLFKAFRRQAGLDSLQLLVSGGAPLPAEMARNYWLLGFTLVEGYGMTETSPVLTVNSPEKVKFGSVGTALDNAEIRIDHPDERGIGEIVVRGPMVMRGYEGNPQETSKVLRDGWLYTGDMGKLDRDGYLYISGRKKNVIVSAAGKNIYPEEIEAALLESPNILEVLVYGQKTGTGREEVAALIHPDLEALAATIGKSPADLTDADISGAMDQEIKQICSSLADYKRIKHLAYSRHELEKTTTRKIKRQQRH